MHAIARKNKRSTHGVDPTEGYFDLFISFDRLLRN
jgi:hypothetical protein